MSGYWILVLHCTTSGADGGAAKFAFQHSTVSPLQVSQQVIIICNTLIDNYISTAWIIFVIDFSFFATVESPQSVTCVGDSVRYPSISRSALFIHASKKSPSPLSPASLEWEWENEFLLLVLSSMPPPSQQTTHPAMPVLSLFRRTWPWVTTQYDCDHTVVTWTQDDSKIGHSTGSHCV